MNRRQRWQMGKADGARLGGHVACGTLRRKVKSAREEKGATVGEKQRISAKSHRLAMPVREQKQRQCVTHETIIPRCHDEKQTIQPGMQIAYVMLFVQCLSVCCKKLTCEFAKQIQFRSIRSVLYGARHVLGRR